MPPAGAAGGPPQANPDGAFGTALDASSDTAPVPSSAAQVVSLMGLVHKKQKWRGQWVERRFKLEDTKLTYEYPPYVPDESGSAKKATTYTLDSASTVDEGMDGPDGRRCMQLVIQVGRSG